MKRVLTLAAVVTSLSALGQKLEVGIDGGYQSYTLHNVDFGNSTDDYTLYQSRISVPVYDFRLAVLSSNYQMGVSLGYSKLKYQAISQPHLPPGFVICGPGPFRLTDQQFPLKAFINRRIVLKRLEIDGGLNLQAVVTGERIETDFGSPGLKMSNRIAGGVQVGATYFATKRLGVSAEVQGCYNNFPAGPLKMDVISFPVTMGVTYRVK